MQWCSKQLLLFANSTDGYSWEKPNLGLYDIARIRPDLAKYGKNNNIIFKGGGVGVYRDIHEPDPSRRFKCFGDGCAGEDKSPGTAVSKNGLVWTEQKELGFPSPQRYDCHNQMLWVPKKDAYIATTRNGFDGAIGRAIGIAESVRNKFEFDTSKAPVTVEEGNSTFQLYSQVTWQWHSVFMGIVMVFDAENPSTEGRVHCRLAWSNSADALSGWHWVDEGGLTGRDFIPLGKDGQEVSTDGQDNNRNDTTTTTTTPSNSKLPPARSDFERPILHSTSPFSTGGAFDSHICFAAVSPVLVPGSTEHRIYYVSAYSTAYSTAYTM
jgi:hypothetical protein